MGPSCGAAKPIPGMMHLFIFWGFLLLAIGTGLVAFEDDFFRPLFGITYLHGDFYLIFSFILDLAGLAAIVGIVMALIRQVRDAAGAAGQPEGRPDRPPVDTRRPRHRVPR